MRVPALSLQAIRRRLRPEMAQFDRMLVGTIHDAEISERA
jgi:hypothetical protein